MKPFARRRRRGAPWLALILLPLLLAACAGGASPSSSWPGLTTDGETVYVAYGPAVYAVSLADGRQVWRFQPEGDAASQFYATPALDDEGNLYVGSYDGDLIALEADSGAIVWAKQLTGGRIVGGPAVAGDLLIVPSSDRTVYAVRRESGQNVWSFQSDRALWATPLVEGELVFLAGLDHTMYALDRQTGDLIWQQELEGALADRPALLNGLLLAGTFGHSLNALDKTNGQVSWSVETTDWVWGNPVVIDETALFGDVSGVLYAVDGQGNPLWDISLDGQIAASPAAANGAVYFVTEAGSVFARQVSDNAPLWEQTVDGQLLADPIVVDTTLVVAALNGENLLTALNTDSGAVRWTYQPAEE